MSVKKFDQETCKYYIKYALIWMSTTLVYRYVASIRSHKSLIQLTCGDDNLGWKIVSI